MDTSASVLERDLPDYVIESVLGKGATSTVYLAKQTTLGRYVAIKRFEPATYMNADVKARFEREAAMWAQFSHQNLVHLYDYRLARGTPYIILEYRDGIELRNLLKSHVKLPPTVVASIAIQTLMALEYIHRFGIVHRDVKPSNLFLTADGVVKLMDFSISLCPELEPLTLPGEIMGTPAYMSPEQGLGKEVTPASDLFSLGVTVYEMLEGCLPFRSDQFKDLLIEIKKGRYEKPSRKLPSAIRNFIRKSLKNNPKKRFLNTASAREYLEDYLMSAKVSDPQICIRDFLRGKNIVNSSPLLFSQVTDGEATERVGFTSFALASLEAALGGRRKTRRLRERLLATLAIVLLIWSYTNPLALRPNWGVLWKFLKGGFHFLRNLF